MIKKTYNSYVEFEKEVFPLFHKKMLEEQESAQSDDFYNDFGFLKPE